MRTVSRYSLPRVLSSANLGTALVTGQLAEEIRKIGKEIEELFGVLDEETLKLQ